MAVVWPYLSRAVAFSKVSIASLATPAQPHTIGSTLVVSVSHNGAGSVNSVTDTAGNSYTLIGTEQTDGGTNKIRLYYAFNVVGNAANVVTVGLSVNSTTTFVSVYELRTTTTDPLISNNQASGSGTTVSSGVLPISAPAILIAMVVHNGGLAVPTNGFLQTPWADEANSTPVFGKFASNLFKLTQTSEAATMSQTSATWGIKAAAFQLSASDGAGLAWELLSILAGAGLSMVRAIASGSTPGSGS